MFDDPVIVQMPADPPRQLILLFHGLGSTPGDMVPLGKRLSAEFPKAAVVSVAGLEPGDMGSGCQWFSVNGITEENRARRVADAMPRFAAGVRHWQNATGASQAQTALIGFSQGAIMALESTQLLETPLAGRVVALAGRFVQPPSRAVADSTTFHFIHGKSDPVIPYGHTVAAAERLIKLGGDVTADVIPFLGHHVDQEVEDLLVERFKGYVPKRTWEQAMQSGPPAQ